MLNTAEQNANQEAAILHCPTFLRLVHDREQEISFV